MATLPKFAGTDDNKYRTLLEVSQAIAAHQSVTELFQDLGRRLHTVLNFSYLSLILHDADHDVMRLHTLHAEGAPSIQPGMEFGMTESPSAEVWRTQQPLIIDDTERETRFGRAMRTLSENGRLAPMCLITKEAPGRSTIGKSDLKARSSPNHFACS